MRPIDLQDNLSKAPLAGREQGPQQASADLGQRHGAQELDVNTCLTRHGRRRETTLTDRTTVSTIIPRMATASSADGAPRQMMKTNRLWSNVLLLLTPPARSTFSPDSCFRLTDRTLCGRPHSPSDSAR